jgi:hypothetical protein
MKMHNYDPAWDYDIIEPPELDKQLVDSLVDKYTSKLLPSLSAFGSFEVWFACDLKPPLLGIYVNGTSSEPVIVLDLYNIEDAKKRYEMTSYDIVATTILHELCHAIQDYNGRSPDEDEAEEFANIYHNFGAILRI